MGTRKALIPLTALAVLGTACGTIAPIQKAPEDVIHDAYYGGAVLKYEGDINGQHVRKYEQFDRGHVDIFLEVSSEGGAVKVYGNDRGPTWSADPTIEWVAIPAEDEIRLYENNRITLLKDGERTRLDFHFGIGDPVLKEAQTQYDEFMAVINGFDEQREQEYYETTLVPLQEWALETLRGH